MGKIKNFKQLKIWQKGIEIVKDIYQLTKRFPKEELYGLTSQMRRAVISTPSNVAEGFKRRHNKEYTQFLHITSGYYSRIRNTTNNFKRTWFYRWN